MCSRTDLGAIVDAFRAFHNAQLQELCAKAERLDLLSSYEIHITNKASPSDVSQKRQKRAESERVADQLNAIFARRALPTMSGHAAAADTGGNPPPLVDEAVTRTTLTTVASVSPALATFHDALHEFAVSCGLNGSTCEFGEVGAN